MDKLWWRAAGRRALKTVAQTAVSMLTVNATGILDADWVAVLSASAMSGLVSLLMSIGGLPELDVVSKEVPDVHDRQLPRGADKQEAGKEEASGAGQEA